MSVKCLICGFEKEYSIVEHLKYEHKMTTNEYKIKFENAEVKSDKAKKQITNNLKKKWSDPEFKKKMCESRQISHRKPEFREKMRKEMNKRLKENPEKYTGFTEHYKTEAYKKWVKSDERRKKTSKQVKERWKNPDYRKKVKKRISEVLSDGRCKTTEKQRRKISESISRLYAEGKIKNECNRYKTGSYVSSMTGENFLYSSSYELDAMKIFDNITEITYWTNKHGIRIKYFYNDKWHIYIPDFLIKFKNNDEYIIEMKGWETDEVKIKTKYTKEKFNNYKIFYTISELEEFINERKQNKIN